MAQEASIKSFVPNANQEGTSLKANEINRSIEYSAEEPISERLIVQVGFNKKLGSLNLVRANGEIVSISGFMTQTFFGEGPRGIKGPRGRNGKNGRVGRDGKKGKTGCEGPIGPTGEQGTAGLEGEDGKIGVIGKYGCPGGIGPRGDTGIRGQVGDQGPMGPQGPSCIVGPQGPTGETPKESVYYGTSTPDSSFFLWAAPAGVAVDVPEEQETEELTASVNNQHIELAEMANDAFSGIATLVVRNLSGGVGPFTYKWEPIDGSWDEPGLVVESQTTANSIRLSMLRTIAPQDTYEYKGKMKVTITDKNSTERKVIDNIVFSFSGFNRRVDTGPVGGGGGGVVVGGGGCLHEDTPVLMWDGTTKRAKYVRVGDSVQSYTCDGMLDESEHGWQDWKTTELKNGKVAATQIKVAFKASYSKSWTINNDVVITDKHPVFAKQGTQWQWLDASELKEGDLLMGVDREVEVGSIVFNEGPVNVVVLDAEPNDNYFAGQTPIVVHNTTQTVKY